MLTKIQKTIFYFFLTVFPVFCLSYFTNPLDLPKIFFLAVFVGLSLFLLAIEVAVKGKFSLKVSRLDIPLVLLVLAYILSAALKTSNKMEAFLFPGTALVVTSGFLIYHFAKKAFEEKKEEVLVPLFFSGLLVSLASILAFTGVFALVPQLPVFLKDSYFSSVGGKLPEVIFLISILPLGIGSIIKEKELLKKALYGLSVIIIVIAATLDVSFILPGKLTAPVLAGTKESWSIAVDALKESPVIGIGPGNYLSAYAKFLPVSANSTPYWAARFSSASNFIFTLTTETGLLGLAAFGLLIFFLIKIFISKYKDPSVISLFILTVSFFVFPANLVLFIVFLLLLVNVSKDKPLDLKLPKLGSSLLFFIAGIIFFLTARSLMGELIYKKALDAINKNDGTASYDTLRNAITANSLVDRYHATYSQVNLALASSLSQKTVLTDQEKEMIAQLISQAIREGKAVVSLNPQRAGNWELLARTYQMIMPFAQGADNFAVQTFNQAVALDPVNPNLRLALGGVYFALGRYDDAIKAFELAIVAKSDLPNAHYNLALTYGEKGEFDKAITEMNTVLSLVEKDSSDYKLATDELSNLEKRKSGVDTEGTENLIPPQESQDQVFSTPIELPEEAGPPTQ